MLRYVRSAADLRVVPGPDTRAVLPAPAFVPPCHAPQPVAVKLSARLLELHAADSDDMQGHAA